MPKTEKIEYKKFSQRLSEENQEWLKRENRNYPSWNLFFDEMRNRYEMANEPRAARAYERNGKDQQKGVQKE